MRLVFVLSHFEKFLWPHLSLKCLACCFWYCFDLYMPLRIAYVSKWLLNFTNPVFVCSCNRDAGLAYEEEWLNDILNIYADNAVKEIDGVKFGYAAYLNPGYKKFTRCDVLLSRTLPAYTKASINMSKDDYGIEKLYR